MPTVGAGNFGKVAAIVIGALPETAVKILQAGELAPAIFPAQGGVAVERVADGDQLAARIIGEAPLAAIGQAVPCQTFMFVPVQFVVLAEGVGIACDELVGIADPVLAAIKMVDTFNLIEAVIIRRAVAETVAFL